MNFVHLDPVRPSWKRVDDFNTGDTVRVPRKVKKRAKKMHVMITARVGKVWLAAHMH